MAFSRKRKRSSIKKPMRSRKRRRIGKGKMKIGRSLPLAGFGKSKMCRLRFVTSFNLDPAAAEITSKVFRANSIFGPDSTTATLRPRGFTENMQFYQHFTVVGSRITVQYLCNTAATTPGIMGILLTAAGTSAATFDGTNDMLETKAFGRNQKFVGTNQQFAYKVSKNFSAKKWFGTTSIIGKDLYRGNSASNPSEGAFFEVVFASTGANNPSAAGFRATIDYLVIFTEPKIIPTSNTD